MYSYVGGCAAAHRLGGNGHRLAGGLQALRAELAQFDVDALAFTAMSEKFMDEVKIGKGQPRPLAHVQQHIAPRIDDEAVAIGLASVLMLAALQAGSIVATARALRDND